MPVQPQPPTGDPPRENSRPPKPKKVASNLEPKMPSNMNPATKSAPGAKDQSRDSDKAPKPMKVPSDLDSKMPNKMDRAIQPAPHVGNQSRSSSQDSLTRKNSLEMLLATPLKEPVNPCCLLLKPLCRNCGVQRAADYMYGRCEHHANTGENCPLKECETLEIKSEYRCAFCQKVFYDTVLAEAEIERSVARTKAKEAQNDIARAEAAIKKSRGAEQAAAEARLNAAKGHADLAKFLMAVADCKIDLVEKAIAGWHDEMDRPKPTKPKSTPPNSVPDAEPVQAATQVQGIVKSGNKIKKMAAESRRDRTPSYHSK